MSRWAVFRETPVGLLTLVEQDGSLTHLLFGRVDVPGARQGETPLLADVCRQLEEYFAGERRAFQLPLEPRGTAFQLKVWQALRAIPYGETRTYRDIAGQAGCPKGFRAVGMANHRNPISIIIPCHRVVGANGTLTGYGGGLTAKRFLLDLEQQALIPRC